MKRWLGVAVLLLLVGTQATAWGRGPKVETEEEKTMYALGLALARNLEPFKLSEEEFELVKLGMSDGVFKKEPKVAFDTYAPKLRALGEERMKLVAAEEKKASAEFLAKAAGEKGAVKTDSGLIITEITPGTGESPKATDTVKVHYHGTLRDGTVFDSSVQRGTPATFGLNRVIPCWTEGLQRMKVGGKSKLVCPSEIAYQDRGQPPKIKPGAALVFEVELLEIVAPAAPPATGKGDASPAKPAAAGH